MLFRHIPERFLSLHTLVALLRLFRLARVDAVGQQRTRFRAARARWPA